MAEQLKPIVLHLTDRGTCAVDYIDYFDEGQYGPDKAFFVCRTQDFTAIAKQMDLCLALQTTPNSMIHSPSRLEIADKWVEPLNFKNSLYPRRAHYKIRFLLRIKFYGEFAYIDLGAKWKPTDMDANRIQVVEAKDLEVINRCWISERDANDICEMIKEKLTYDGTQSYKVVDGVPVMEQNSSNELITAYAAQKAEDERIKQEQEALEAAILISDEDDIFSDDEGLISL